MREDLSGEVLGRIVSRIGLPAKGFIEFIPLKPYFRLDGVDYVPLGGRRALRNGAFSLDLTLYEHTGVEYLMLCAAGRHIVRLQGRANDCYDINFLISRGRKAPARPEVAHESLY